MTDSKILYKKLQKMSRYKKNTIDKQTVLAYLDRRKRLHIICGYMGQALIFAYLCSYLEVIMKENLIKPESFPYDEFLEIKEQRDNYVGHWLSSGDGNNAIINVQPGWDMWNDNTCADRDRFLAMNLWGMAESAKWKSDCVFPHLQPWYGVGIIATPFGAEYMWSGNSAPQTHHIFKSVDELNGIETPQVGKTGPMKEVLDRIAWYREVTKDQLPISLTDTQTPFNTASLLVETNEFFANISLAPEKLAGLLKAIAEVIINYSDMQLEAIGPNTSMPGHQMLCHSSLKGISLSDDNMTMLSPKAYEEVMVPYINMISEHFGGVALHSCGRVAHCIGALKKVKGLQQVEHAVCCITKDSDPDPNEPEPLAQGYRGTGVILKVRLNKTESELLDKLIYPDLKCVLVITGAESKAESEQVYDTFKKKIDQITSKW